MATKTYTVKSPLNHDGEDFAVGSTVELDGKQAEPLLNVGAIEAGAVKAKVAIPEGEEKMALIKQAIAGLDKADATLWSSDGVKPKTDAIAAVTGWPVFAKERDEAIAE